MAWFLEDTPEDTTPAGNAVRALLRLAGVTCARCALLGAKTPWNRVRLTQGFGTKATSRAIKVHRLEDDMRGAIAVRRFELVAHMAIAQ
jgi:ribosomal protein S5